MDRNHATWDVKDVSKNHWTPDKFGVLVRKALELSDEYVWVYINRAPRWWSEPDGKPVNIPAAYPAAVRKARKGLTAD